PGAGLSMGMLICFFPNTTTTPVQWPGRHRMVFMIYWLGENLRLLALVRRGGLALHPPGLRRHPAMHTSLRHWLVSHPIPQCERRLLATGLPRSRSVMYPLRVS